MNTRLDWNICDAKSEVFNIDITHKLYTTNTTVFHDALGGQIQSLIFCRLQIVVSYIMSYTIY